MSTELSCRVAGDGSDVVGPPPPPQMRVGKPNSNVLKFKFNSSSEFLTEQSSSSKLTIKRVGGGG